MGKPTGFIEYERKGNRAQDPKKRVKHYNEFYTPLSESDRRNQASRCKDCGVPFCQAGVEYEGEYFGCPLNNLVPEWNDFLYRGNDQQALHRLLKTNNFPEFTSRVCPALCEGACTGHLHSTPVTNRDNEKFIIETGYEKGYIKAKKPTQRTGKKIAVIGSGPAGMAAADQLNRRGHNVTIFEREDRPGGLLMYGIPNMKLEKSVIERKVNLMKEEGIEFVMNTEVGKTVAAADIMKQYDAVILACGASKPRDLEVPGRDALGVHFAVPYLTFSTKNLLDPSVVIPEEWNAAGKTVLVIGGGDTANDCVATAIRQGCKNVIQFSRRPCPPTVRPADNPWPMPAKILSVDYGQQESIAVFGKDPRMYSTRVKEVLKNEEGKMIGVKAVKLTQKKDAKTGRMKMVEVAGSEYELKCDMLLIASGFMGVEDEVAKAFKVAVDKKGNVSAESGHGTSVKGLFSAGDCHRGSSLVVWAIREGRETAKEVDEYLMGYTNLM